MQPGTSPHQHIETRWGQPFWDLLRDFAAQNLTRADTARALGLKPGALRYHLTENPDKDPFPPVVGVARQYAADTGELFRDACIRLAKTHTMTAASRMIGYADVGAFKRALATRGIQVKFVDNRTNKGRRQYLTTRRRIPDAVTRRYAELRLAGTPDEDAANKVGHSANALRRRVQFVFPALWKQILVLSKQNQTTNRTRLVQRAYQSSLPRGQHVQH